jgi:hypothetical protein
MIHDYKTKHDSWFKGSVSRQWFMETVKGN